MTKLITRLRSQLLLAGHVFRLPVLQDFRKIGLPNELIEHENPEGYVFDVSYVDDVALPIADSAANITYKIAAVASIAYGVFILFGCRVGKSSPPLL